MIFVQQACRVIFYTNRLLFSGQRPLYYSNVKPLCRGNPNSTIHKIYCIYYVNSCLDINECLDTPNICHHNANCTNTDGNYSCQCLKGFTGNGYLSCLGKFKIKVKLVRFKIKIIQL